MSAFDGRRRDQIYFIFFIFHLVCSVFIDLQHWWPQQYVPGIFIKMNNFYLEQSNDPHFVFNHEPSYAWFRSFIVLEAVFQIPCFIMGAYAFFKDDRRFYPLIIAYCASSSTTTIACIANVFYGEQAATLTEDQRNFMLSNYVPFLIIPLYIAFDLSSRLVDIVSQSTPSQAKSKAQ